MQADSNNYINNSKKKNYTTNHVNRKQFEWLAGEVILFDLQLTSPVNLLGTKIARVCIYIYIFTTLVHRSKLIEKEKKLKA